MLFDGRCVDTSSSSSSSYMVVARWESVVWEERDGGGFHQLALEFFVHPCKKQCFRKIIHAHMYLYTYEYISSYFFTHKMKSWCGKRRKICKKEEAIVRMSESCFKWHQSAEYITKRINPVSELEWVNNMRWYQCTKRTHPPRS